MMNEEREERIRQILGDLTREVLVAMIENCSDIATTPVDNVAAKANEFYEIVLNLINKTID